MPSLFHAAGRFLARAIRETGEMVLFCVGGQSLKVAARKGKPWFRSQAIASVNVAWNGWDFQIPTEDLVLAGTPVTPASGNTIQQTARNGTVSTYELMAPDGEQCYRQDSSGYLTRVHTKQVS